MLVSFSSLSFSLFFFSPFPFLSIFPFFSSFLVYLSLLLSVFLSLVLLAQQWAVAAVGVFLATVLDLRQVQVFHCFSLRLCLPLVLLSLRCAGPVLSSGPPILTFPAEQRLICTGVRLNYMLELILLGLIHLLGFSLLSLLCILFSTASLTSLFSFSCFPMEAHMVLPAFALS